MNLSCGGKTEKSTEPTFSQLKKALIRSGYEIEVIPRQSLEKLATNSTKQRSIMGLIMPDEYTIGISSELPIKERAVTLLHEMIHLYDESLPEAEVEKFTLEMERKLTPSQFGLLEFFVTQ